jgi:hypothetical protein
MRVKRDRSNVQVLIAISGMVSELKNVVTAIRIHSAANSTVCSAVLSGTWASSWRLATSTARSSRRKVSEHFSQNVCAASIAVGSPRSSAASSLACARSSCASSAPERPLRLFARLAAGQPLPGRQRRARDSQRSLLFNARTTPALRYIGLSKPVLLYPGLNARVTAQVATLLRLSEQSRPALADPL